jgi:hypothetical protein
MHTLIVSKQLLRSMQVAKSCKFFVASS